MTDSENSYSNTINRAEYNETYFHCWVKSICISYAYSSPLSKVVRPRNTFDYCLSRQQQHARTANVQMRMNEEKNSPKTASIPPPFSFRGNIFFVCCSQRSPVRAAHTHRHAEVRMQEEIKLLCLTDFQTS